MRARWLAFGARGRQISGSDQTIALSDGRTLGFQTLGDPEGPALMYFHGTPGSRLMLSPEDPIIQSLGAHVVMPDRPGYGMSDPKPDRTLLDWPQDVVELADHLGIGTFAVAGESGGSPHALACAAARPERVFVALLLSCPSPANERGITKGMGFAQRMGLAIERYAPWVPRWISRHNYAAFKKDPEGFLDGLAAQLSAPDSALLKQAAYRSAILRDLGEAYRQGPEGHVVDGPLTMSSRSWGFDLSAVSIPVFLWQGEADNLVAPGMGRYLARELPRATYYTVPDAGHLLSDHPRVIEQMRAALDSVLQG